MFENATGKRRFSPAFSLASALTSRRSFSILALPIFPAFSRRVETVIALEEPDRVPVVPFNASYAQRAYGSCYANICYNYQKAGEAAVRFYRDHPQIDVIMFSGFTSGRANEPPPR